MPINPGPARRLEVPFHNRLLFKAALLGSAWLWSAPGYLHGQETLRSLLPAGNGRELVMTACSQCHGADAVLLLRDGRQGWKDRVEDMVLRGTQLLPDEAEIVIDYLATYRGFNSPVTSPDEASQSDQSHDSDDSMRTAFLPPGPGKELVQTHCSVCHELQRVISIRRSRENWEQVTDDMIARGVAISDEVRDSVVSYLSTAFGLE